MAVSITATVNSAQMTFTFDENQKEAYLGSGTYGKVFKAKTSTGEAVAVKEITAWDKKGLQATNEDIKQLRELTDVRYAHRNIIRIFDIIQNGIKVYVVMEYCPGGNLANYIMKYRKASPPQAVEEGHTAIITKHILAGLVHLHDKEPRIIHCDLTPQNVLLEWRKGESTPTAKLCDIDQLYKMNMLETVPGQIIGRERICAPLYTSPERLAGKTSGRGMDIWSLGCIVIDTSRSTEDWIFARTSKTGEEEKQRMKDFKPQELPDFIINGGAPVCPASAPPLARIFILSCLNRDPKQRPRATQLLESPWLRQFKVKYSGILTAGQKLLPGESLRSRNGMFRLTLHRSGNLTLVNDTTDLALWSSEPVLQPPKWCIMQGDGNLVLYSENDEVVWRSDTHGKAGAHLMVEDEGRLHIYYKDICIWTNPQARPP